MLKLGIFSLQVLQRVDLIISQCGQFIPGRRFTGLLRAYDRDRPALLSRLGSVIFRIWGGLRPQRSALDSKPIFEWLLAVQIDSFQELLTTIRSFCAPVYNVDRAALQVQPNTVALTRNQLRSVGGQALTQVC